MMLMEGPCGSQAEPLEPHWTETAGPRRIVIIFFFCCCSDSAVVFVVERG